MIQRAAHTLTLLTFLALATPLYAEKTEVSIANKVDTKLLKKQASAFRGWDHLVDKLRKAGASEQQIKEVYQSPRMPKFGYISFNVNPRESTRIYKEFYSKSKLKLARNFLAKYKTIFAAAEKEFQVSRNVVAAILLVETHYGSYTGRSVVVNRLSRLAAIAEPSNLARNVKDNKKKFPDTTTEKVEARGKYIEDLFFPEIPALFEIAQKGNINVFHIKGSRAGAFGIPQFLPTTYMKFAMDANGDGSISLFQEADAIWSTSNFLSSFGWKDGASRSEKEKVIWKYNRSKPYVDTILYLTAQLGG